MPLIRVDLFPGRAPELKRELARVLTEACVQVLGNDPKDVTIMFSEVEPFDWIVAGQPLGPVRSR